MFQNGNGERTLRVSFFKEFSLLLRLLFNYKYRSDSSEREAGAGWGVLSVSFTVISPRPTRCPTSNKCSKKVCYWEKK